MITLADFTRLIELLGDQAVEDIGWAEGLCPPEDADDVAEDVIFVICNSGMKNTIARQIFHAVMRALLDGKPAVSAFGHQGKACAIQEIWDRRQEVFTAYNAAGDKLAFLSGLRWIGEITKYHLAKNFGLDLAKPDVHLQRLADRENTTPQALCERLAVASGFRIATVDTILWRACATGVLNSKTGEIQNG